MELGDGDAVRLDEARVLELVGSRYTWRGYDVYPGAEGQWTVWRGRAFLGVTATLDEAVEVINAHYADAVGLDEERVLDLVRRRYTWRGYGVYPGDDAESQWTVWHDRDFLGVTRTLAEAVAVINAHNADHLPNTIYHLSETLDRQHEAWER